MIRLLEIIDGYTVALTFSYDKLGCDWTECRISKGDYSSSIESLLHTNGIYNVERDSIEPMAMETISKIKQWADENGY
jgi:hypothetical protein